MHLKAGDFFFDRDAKYIYEREDIIFDKWVLGNEIATYKYINSILTLILHNN